MHHQGHSLDEASNRGGAPSHSWVHRQISSIFHGEPFILGARTRASPRVQKSNVHRHPPPTPNSSPQSGQRSPTSVRSMIDPGASPVSSAGSMPRNDFGTLQMHTNPPSVAYTRPRSNGSGARAERHLSRALSNPHRRRTRRGSRRSRRHWTCLPNIRNPKHRRKAIACLATGAILTVMLSTYLALAISKVITGRIWHVTLIMFILATAILFCHNLIRFSMLVLHSRRRALTCGIPSELDEEGFAQPRKPIRVILARDEELGLHEHDEAAQSNSSITAPPPAYGLWRCSVRADPNLIHWKRISEPSLQEETRNLLLDGDSSNRPPSYE